MFCPTCGRNNSSERKFCAACGTNLEAVSQALSGSDDDFFTKIDTALDQLLARYAEHVFKNAPSHAAEQRIGKSWQVLGQSAVTSFVDILLFTLMWNIIPLRFLILLISTPVRLISQRDKNKRGAMLDSRRVAELSDPALQQWLPESIGSVTEHTTAILADSDPAKQNVGLKTIPPKLKPESDRHARDRE
jgi:Double zinc ribbon